MRNIYSSSCCEGEQIVGRIIYGKKFPFGTVSEETYETDMTALNSKVSQLNTAVTNAQSGVTANEAEIRNLKSGISDIRTQIGNLISTDAEHDREIAVLENSVSATGMQLTETRSAVSDLSTRVAGISTSLSSVSNNLSALETTVSVLDGRVTNDVARIDRSVAAVQSDMVEHEREIATLKSKVASDEASLSETREKVSEISTRMANYETTQATLRNQILNVSDSLNSRCDSLSTSLNAVRQDIQELRRTVGELSVSTAASIATINQRLANLEGGEAIGILSFTATPQTCEKGATENIVLEWETKGDVKTTKINGEVVSGNTKTIKNVQSNQEFTLTVSDAKGITDSKKVSVTFSNYIYWGTDTSGLMTEGTVKGLDYSELTDQRTRNISTNPYGAYVYYSYPKRLGASIFSVSGFTGGFTSPETVVINNPSGYQEDYYVYRSVNKLTGSLEIVVK